MGAVDAQNGQAEFVEGEPDLRAPEEEAVEELDDETLLEQELDNEEVLEQDVEEDLLEETLEDLEAEGAEEQAGIELETVAGDDTETVVDENEVEASLDEILRLRAAGEEPVEEKETVQSLRVSTVDEADIAEVVPAQRGEFVCRGCYLLKRRELLTDVERGLCRDCTADGGNGVISTMTPPG